MHTKIVIERFNPTKKSNVAITWQLLEQDAEANAFLSWQWIGNWLDVVTDKLFLVEAYHGDKVVGLGFFVENTRKVFGCYFIKQWWLHRTGIQQEDQMWIEYNDFLLDKSCSASVREEMVKAIGNFDRSIREVIIGLSTDEVLDCFTNSFTKLNFLEETVVTTNGYLADLSDSKGNYLNKSLSKNTFRQISRSKQILQEEGELHFEVFSGSDKLSELYPMIAKIHIEKWQVTDEGSGFSNSVFEAFHKRLIANNADNMVQIAVLSVNKLELGYLINFVYKNRVYFYLSAFQKNSDNKVKIGMTLHCEAISYYSEKGVESYDFLGGDARYKQSLSDTKYGLKMKCYYRNDFLLRFENFLKRVKTKLLA